MRRACAWGALAVGVALWPVMARADDYPTDARVRYVLVCLEVTGDDPYGVSRCSCRVDQIARIISYRDFRAVETVMALRGATGQRAAALRDVPVMKDLLDRFHVAEVDAEFACR